MLGIAAQKSSEQLIPNDLFLVVRSAFLHFLELVHQQVEIALI